jgi:NTE family protein
MPKLTATDDLDRRSGTLLTVTPLFAGLDGAAVADVLACARTRRYVAGQLIFREGEASDRVLVLERGLAEVFVPSVADSSATFVGCLHPGDVVGEVGVVTDRPRSASVIARSGVRALEITRDDFLRLLARHPRLQANLTHVLGGRLAEGNASLRDHRSGEVVTLVAGVGRARAAAAVISAAQSASPRPIAVLDLLASGGSDGEIPAPLADAVVPHSATDAMERLDGLTASYRTVVLAVRHDDPGLARLLEQADRTLALLTPEEAAALGPGLHATSPGADLVLFSGAAETVSSVGEGRVMRRCAAELPARDAGWLGRHVARTKLGLALGAGGAKCFAHAGVLQVLEGAGYEVDYVAGSSMGAVVAVWRALGLSAARIAATLEERCAPEPVVEAVFRKGDAGGGRKVFARIFRETTADRAFADLTIPATVMTADLASRSPAPIRSGPLWEALVAALSIPGLYPPYVRGAQRLVDAVSLTPVPLDAVVEAGADVTLAVNLLGRETLPSWPGEDGRLVPPAAHTGKARDTVVEVLELTQVDASARQTARADVPVTPRFGPGSWRNMQLGPQCLEAGRVAAEAALSHLAALARPQGAAAGHAS